MVHTKPVNIKHVYQIFQDKNRGTIDDRLIVCQIFLVNGCFQHLLSRHSQNTKAKREDVFALDEWKG